MELYFNDEGNIGIMFNCDWEEEHGLGIFFNVEENSFVVGDCSIAFWGY